MLFFLTFFRVSKVIKACASVIYLTKGFKTLQPPPALENSYLNLILVLRVNYLIRT